MALLKNMDSGEHITRHVSLQSSQEVIREVQTLLSGEQYIQRIGDPAVSYDVTAYVNRAGKALLESADDTAALLEVTVRHGVYYGRITKLKINDRLPGDWFEATVTLCKEVEDD